MLLVLHTYLAHIRLSNVHYYFTHQYTDYSVVFSHFIFLTWYQSLSSDFLVPMDISSILSLPSSSSNSYCQKRVTAVKPTAPRTLGFCQFYWSNRQSQGTYWKIWQSWGKPNQERPKTTSHVPTRTGWSFCLTNTHLHTPSVLYTRLTRREHLCHALPRAYPVLRPATSALKWHHTAISIDVIILSRLSLTLTKVKNFQQGLSWSIFRVDFDFGLYFFIWGF